MICGDWTGLTWCGDRWIIITDDQTGLEVDTTTSNSISLNQATGIITFRTKDMRDVGMRYYSIDYVLKDF
jgi:hypothetical protein